MLEELKPEEPSPATSLLKELYLISATEIKAFQNTLLPHNSKNFDNHPETTKRILVAISRLTTDELQNIYRLAETNNQIVGIHDLRKFVNLYKELTTNTDPNIY